MYADTSYKFDYGSGPVPYRTNEFGPYTHYIDNTNPSATDTGNPFGTPALPRRTWPYPVPAGSVVQVRGGPYNFFNSSRNLVFGGNGSAAQPIFFTGITTNQAEMPVIANLEAFYWGNWTIVERFRFINSCKTSTRPMLKGGPVLNVCVRDCLFDGTGQEGWQICITTGGATGNSAAMYTLNLVVLRNLMRNYGDWQATVENDATGVIASENATNVWVLDNEMHHMGGDGMRFGPDQGAEVSGANYYAGRNHLHDNRENAIDIKQARHTVLSENIMHGFAPSSSSGGTALAIHYEPEDVWILNNTIYDTRRGIVSSGVKDCYVIGNRFYDCSQYPIFLDRGGGTFYVANNTIVSCANGPVTSGVVDALHYWNNIVSDVTPAGGYHFAIMDTGVAADSTAETFLFNQSSGDLRIRWGDRTYTDVQNWIAGSSQGGGSFRADPSFVQDGSRNYHITSASPARDAGVSISDLAQKFQSSFGVPLGIDFDGNARPSGPATDIGADEIPDGSTPQNSPPTLSPIADQTADAGQTVSVTAHASDSDTPAQTLTFRLVQAPSGATIGASSGVFTWATSSSQSSSTNRVTVAVDDSGNPSMSATQSFTITVRALPPPNTAPALDPIPDQSVDAGQTVSVTAHASDSDTPAQTLTFRLVQAPSGATIDASSGVFTWATSSSQSSSTNRVTVAVDDSGNPSMSATQSFTITVRALPPPNTAPALDPIPDQSVDAGQTVSVTAHASDSDTPAQTLTFRLVQAPSGATIDASSGVFTWATSSSQSSSTNRVTVAVDDSGNPSMSATQSFTITVRALPPPNTAPTLDPIPDQSVDAGQTVSVTAHASDSDVPAQALTFRLVQAPSGATIDPSSGVFSWATRLSQPASTNRVMVAVDDSGSPLMSATQSFNITVRGVVTPPANTAPVLEPIDDQVADAGQAISVSAHATDSDTPAQTLIFRLVEGSTNATVDASSGVFSWTPSSSDAPSTNRFAVAVDDNGSPSMSATQSFNITVRAVVTPPPNTPPILDPILDQVADAGQTVSVITHANDSDTPAQTLSFRLLEGSTNATIDASSGLFSWTPSSSEAPSTNRFAVAVDDSGSPSMSTTQSFNVIVRAVVTPSFDLTVDDSQGAV